MANATVAKIEQLLTRDEIDTAVTFEEALAAAGNVGVPQELLAAIGSEFYVLKDKRLLVGKPFFIRQAEFHDGDFTHDGVVQSFLLLRIITKDAVSVDGQDRTALIVTDGSTGLMRDIARLIERRVKDHGFTEEAAAQNILVPNGLTVSDYTYVDERTGDESPASTYYIA